MLKIYSLSFICLAISFHLNESVIFEHCWKHSYGRGVGLSPSKCNGNEDKNGLLCYPKCNKGYYGIGPVCWQQCPSGYVDTGVFCSPKGLDFFKKLTIAKKTYGRGAGTLMKCADHLVLDAGLCYQQCEDNYKQVGPVCWKNCQGTYSVDCGAFCSIDMSSCKSTLIEMGMTSLDMLYQISKLDPAQILNGFKNAEKSLGIKICTNENQEVKNETTLGFQSTRFMTRSTTTL